MAAVPPQIPGLVGWRPLARGGFATVWEAKQLSLNRLVAVKVDRRTLDSESEQRRFLREAGAAGRMSGHPGIVTVHDAGILTDDRPYLVMALCEGGSLTKWVKGEPRPSQEEVREVGVRIADALAATHERGVLHRDVKPANILIDAYGHSGLADFGLAALPDPGMELSETLEAITPAYAPPEVFHRRPPTEAGDVYSLGATLYAVLSGRPPRWPDDGTPNIVDMFERLEEPIDRIPGVDDELMDALLAAMASDPADRPTAGEFRDRLSALPLGAPARNGSAAGSGLGSVTTLTTAQRAESRRTADRAGAAGEPPLDTEFASGPAAPGPGGNKPPPEQLIDDPADDRHRSRRRGILAAAVAVILAVALTVVVADLLPRGGTVAPAGTAPPASAAPGSPATSPSAEPTPTPTPSTSASESRPAGVVPASFEDCSDQLGEGSYCTPEPECWGGIVAYADALRQLESIDCDKYHRYQTFAAADLDFVPLRQSEINNLPAAKKLCNPRQLNRVLANPADRDWETHGIPAQFRGETIFRCVFGPVDRAGSIPLRKP